MNRSHSDRGALVGDATVAVPRTSARETIERGSGNDSAGFAHDTGDPGSKRSVLPWIISAVCIVVTFGLLVAFAIGRTGGDPELSATEVDATTTQPAKPTAPDTTPASGPVPTAPPPSPLPSPPPQPTAPIPTLPPAPASAGNFLTVVATVARTCGSAGNGDCFVAVRAGPTSTTAELARLDEGESVLVVCQVLGQSVRSSVLGSTTQVWVRDTQGRYMTAAFLDVSEWSPFLISQPCS